MASKLSTIDTGNKLKTLDTGSKLTRQPRKKKGQIEEGSLEKICTKELNEYQQAFRDRAKAEEKRFELATDTEYWTCLCFQTREQADAFAEAMTGMEPGHKYVDGVALARALGIELPAGGVPYNVSSRKDKKLSRLAKTV